MVKGKGKSEKKKGRVQEPEPKTHKKREREERNEVSLDDAADNDDDTFFLPNPHPKTINLPRTPRRRLKRSKP